MKSSNEREHRHLIDSAIIWITLGTLFIIPIIFNYFHIVSVFAELKLVTLHLGAGLIAILWLWEFARNGHFPVSISKQKPGRDLLQKIGKNPTRWALIGAVIWFFALTISTLLSPLSSISFFGAEDNRSGYNLYDYISLFFICFSVAFRFRSIATLKLFTYTLVGSGTIVAAYGIAQHFDWDPIGGNIGLNRVQASFGNPLDFGAYMVMAIPTTLALAYFATKQKYIWASLIIVPLGLQLAGLWFSGGRGPYISTLAGLITFFLIAAVVGHIKSIIRPALVLILGGLLATAIIALPSSQNERGTAKSLGIQRILSIENQITGAGRTTNEVTDGLYGRLNIWNSTLELATHWSVPAAESPVNTFLRPVFGLGPDMFVYSFSMVEKPRAGLQLVDHTHNYGLQILMEQGFLGLFGFLIFVSSLVVIAFALAKRLRSSDYQLSISKILVLSLLPAMLGKIIEIQTGVPRVSDLTMMFALFGATIALYSVINGQRINNNNQHITIPRSPSYAFLVPRMIGLGAVAILIMTIFIGWDIRRLSASRTHAVGSSTTSSATQVQAWADAQSRAPERPSFTNKLFTEYFHAAIYHRDRGDETEAAQLMLAARELLLEFEKYDPFKRDTQINLFQTEVALTQWGYLEYAEQAIDRSKKIIERYPSYPSFISIIATNMTLIGMHDLAIEYAEYAINVEKVTKPWPKAWYAKGRALYELGHLDESILVLNTAVEKQPGSEGAIYAHKILAHIYLKRGDPGDNELSIFHKRKGGEPITVQE